MPIREDNIKPVQSWGIVNLGGKLYASKDGKHYDRPDIHNAEIAPPYPCITFDKGAITQEYFLAMHKLQKHKS